MAVWRSTWGVYSPRTPCPSRRAKTAQEGSPASLDPVATKGRLPGARWRWFARFTAIALLPAAILAALSPRSYLVYGSLTATLVALYLAVIVVLQGFFVILVGEKSTLAVVASTLLIAALFTPLRRLIQSFINRRFYRRKYDARKTLETFSVQLRHETDLAALSDDLVEVVRETMQPAHVSLWLRQDPPSRGSEGRE